ncbi:patatin-like phospholipase [Edaphobacter aggregans]|uniref:Patatin-like phospholipase n=1 Tax=Edaphobacter aggregans TaxID=570835 RepID=A0A428MM68_9BACT|nr:hypothetical protein [Edaphobacter aggregans]RSL18007.1 patatin-like phospholipase [Edaphobacter aggregans]
MEERGGTEQDLKSIESILLSGEQTWFENVRKRRDPQAPPDRAIGVAFSGGGIRSATFNLGVLQAFASFGLLHRIGYISSVSGGSYINSWLASWIRKDGIGHVAKALADENKQGNAADRYRDQLPVTHLRRYSSYLTPQRGLMSSDVWTAVAAYVLRLLPNLLFVALLALILVVAPYIARDLFKMTSGEYARKAANSLNLQLRRDVGEELKGIGHTGTFDDDRDNAFGAVVRQTLELQAAMASAQSSKQMKPDSVSPEEKLLLEKINHLEAFRTKPSLYVDQSVETALTALRNELELRQKSGSSQSPDVPRSVLEDKMRTFLDKSPYYPGEGWVVKASLADLKAKLTSAELAACKSISDIDCIPDLKVDQATTRAMNEVGNSISKGYEQILGSNGRPNPEAVATLESVKNDLCRWFPLSIASGQLHEGTAHVPPCGEVLSAEERQSKAVNEVVQSIVTDLPILDDAQALPRSALKMLKSLTDGLDKQASRLQSYSWRLPEDPHWISTAWRIRLFAGAGLFIMLFPSGLGYNPKDATASRRAAAKHAFTTFFAVLLFGPVVVGVGLARRLDYVSGYHPAIPWGFFLISFLCVVFFTYRVGAFPGLLKRLQSSDRWRPIVSLVCTGIIGMLCFWASSFLLARFFDLGDHFETGLLLSAASAPLLLLLAYVLMASAGMALLPFQSSAQEWLNRIWGDTAILTLGWLGVASLALLWPEFMARVGPHLYNLRGGYKLPGATALLGWILTTVGGVLSAYSGKTGGPAPSESNPTPWIVRVKPSGDQYQFMGFLARVAPYVFLLGLLILLSSLNHLLLATVEGYIPQQLKVWLRPEYIFLAVSVALLVVLGRMIDVNRLSLHNVYRFRLIECYLAASAGTGAPTITMASLTADAKQEEDQGEKVDPLQRAESNKFDGPFPIINCTLNVTKSGNLDLQKRRAMNFIFSPVYCGYIRYPSPDEQLDSNDPLAKSGLIKTDFCSSKGTPALSLTDSQESSNSITLGSAMAISGGAQSPNEGAHTSPAVAALMTAANVRLGWWLGNPRNRSTRCDEGPKTGLKPMLDELFAQATDKSEYIYLSDGGHFENLGLFELVRRKCKVIILCDADCDPHYRFEDLVNAMELCQINFGANITLPTDGLLSYGDSKFNRSSYAIGSIEYNDGSSGTILYLKPAVASASSVIVKSFDRDNAQFPHETTINQWFDESQFEAYRLLGRETATSCLKNYLDQPGTVQPIPIATPPRGWKGTAAEWIQNRKDVREIILNHSHGEAADARRA